ncbi:hypothetical protein GCM10008164_00960 [Achromobacter xylosoxidans]|nr:hypothetical protein GCM10008164_00960 [Achromobacter xylosoxidans]
MHGTAQQIYRAVKGQQRGIFLKAYARLHGDAAAIALDPGYLVRAMAPGMRGEARALPAVCDAQAVPGTDRESAREGCAGGVAGRGETAVLPEYTAGGAECN